MFLHTFKLPTKHRATLIRDVPYTMLELGLYENFKTLLKKYRKRDTLTTMEELGAAAVTGGLVGLMTNPLDLVKTRLMTGVRTRGTDYAFKGCSPWREKTPVQEGVRGLGYDNHTHLAHLCLPSYVIFPHIHPSAHS